MRKDPSQTIGARLKSFTEFIVSSKAKPAGSVRVHGGSIGKATSFAVALRSGKRRPVSILRLRPVVLTLDVGWFFAGSGNG